MENLNLKKTRVALAVAAIATAGAAQAGDIAGAVAAAAGTFVAPALTIGASGDVTPTLSLGKAFLIDFSAATTKAAAANTGSVEYYATFYDAVGKYLGAQLVGTDTNTAGLKIAATLASGATTEGSAAGATKVALVAIPLNSAEDLGGTTQVVGKVTFQSGGANLDTKMGLTLTASTKLAAGANTFTAGDFGTVGAVPAAGSLAEEVAGWAFALSNGYTGPVIASVTKNGLTDATLTTNVGLAAIAATDIKTSLRTLSAVDASATGEAVYAGDGTTTIANGARTLKIAATDKINGAGTTAGDFINQYAKLEVLSAGAALTDMAGNVAPNDVVNVAIATRGKPALAAGTAKVVLSSVGGFNDANLVKLFAGTNVAADFTGASAAVKVRLNEAAQLTSYNATDIETVATLADTTDTDRAITIAPAYLVSATSTTTNASGVTVTNDGSDLNLALNLQTLLANAAANYPDKTFTLKANAAGELVVNDGTTDTNVTVALNYVSGNAWSVTNTGTAMAAAGDSIAATKILMGVAPSVKKATSDADVDGFLDGVSVDTQGLALTNGGTDVAAAAGISGTGISVKTSQGGTPVVLASTVDAASASKLVVKLTSPAGADWNASGTANATDAALYIQANFKTSLLSVDAAGTPGTAGTDLLFNPLVAALNATTPSAIKYKAVSSWVDGNALPLFNTNAAASGATALSLLGNTASNTFTDGAAPVVTKALYSKTGTDANTAAEFGSVELVLSEGTSNVTDAGDIYIDGKGWTLANLNANLTADPAVDNTNAGTGSVDLDNVPATVVGKTVTLAYAGAASAADLASNALVVKSGLTITAPLVDTLEMTKVEAASGYLLGTPVDKLTVTYNQSDVAWKAGALDADKNGVFQVRATVGTLQNSAGAGTDDFIFSVPNSGVTFLTGANAGKIELLLADSAGKPIQLPGNTTAVWVDYSPKGTAILTSATATANGVTNGTLSGDAADDAGRFAGAPTADTDTQKVASIVALSLSKNKHNSGNFYTQTIYGTAKRGSADLPDYSQVRVDVVRVGKSTTAATYANAGRVGDGSVEIQRVVNDKTGGAVANVQEIALLNKAVTAGDLQALAKDNADIAAAYKKYTDAVAVNSADASKLQVTYEELGIKLANKWFDSWAGAGQTSLSSPTLQAFVEVTTGAGGKGVGNSDADNGGNNSSASDNNDASTGRTATLVRKLANVVKNGTTTYEVRVDLSNGNVTQVENSNATGGTNSAIKGGVIELVPAVLGKAATTKPYYEILDSTFGVVKGGKYQVAAAVPESKLTDKTGTLDVSVKSDEAFVLISVRDPLTGLYSLTNSAEKTFTGYLPFAADLKGTGAAVARNLDLDKVAKVAASDGGWKLMGIPGTPDRLTAQAKAPLDLARLFITIQETDGDIGTLWDLDSDTSDQAFTLLNNAPTLAYQIGTVAKNQLALTAGQGFAMNSAGKARQDQGVATSETAASFNDVKLLNNTAAWGGATSLFVPLQSSAVLENVELNKGWSLVALQADETLAAFIARNSSALSMVVIPDAAGAYTWDKTAGIVPELDIKKGGSAFVFVSPVAPATKAIVDLKP